jgi:copper(I)-binding protein/uncharacterized protein YceK
LFHPNIYAKDFIMFENKHVIIPLIAILTLTGCGSTTKSNSAPPSSSASTSASHTADPTASASTTAPSSAAATTEPTTTASAKPKPTASVSATADPEPTLAYDEVTVSGAWIKAMDTAMPMDGMYMTAAFMSITNLSNADITLTGGSANFAKEVQVHEVVNGKMRPKEGGLVIKAGTTEILKAGGTHVMFVFMPSKLMAGDEATFKLQFNGNRVLTVKAPVKMTNAGSESYTPMSTSSK